MLVTGLPANWAAQAVYQGELGVYPGSITEDEQGNILIYDRGSRLLMQFDPSGAISTLADLSTGIALGEVREIAYQPSHDRLLLLTTLGGLYAYAGGQLTMLRPFGILASQFAVDPRDGSFYAGIHDDGTPIRHYDASGNLLSTVLASARGPFQFALDTANNRLYYGETYAGRVAMLDLATGAAGSIAEGVGIAGTTEPIGVAFDGSGRLHYYHVQGDAAGDGLIRYDGTGSVQVTPSIGGAGQIIWSSARGVFVNAQGVGANLVAYPADGTPGSSLTPYVNAFAIGQLADGRIVLQDPDTSLLVLATTDGYAAFGDEALPQCSDFVADADGTLYVAAGEQILRVNADGSVSEVGQRPGEHLLNLAYDASTGEIAHVGTTSSGVPAVSIGRMTLEGQSRTVATLDQVTTGANIPSLAADASGNLYLLDRHANTIYRIQPGSDAAEVWAANVLDSEAITVPGLAYLASEDALLVTTIENYELWPLDGSAKRVFATNDGAVDNFATFIANDGDLVAIHSGEIFRITPTRYDGAVGNDTLRGGASDGSFNGAAGDDTLDGGAGSDTADFSGNASAYTVSLASNGTLTVSGTDGTDSLSHIEQISFDDATVSLIDALPTVQFSCERHAAKVQAYFLGVLGRAPTTTEASQFTTLLQSNQSRVWWYDAAQTTMDGSLMSYLMAQSEYTALVANPNATIVSTVYGRLTGQSAPQALIDQYVGRLEAGTLFSRGVANKMLGELYLSPKGDGTLGTVAGFTDNRAYLDGTSLRGFMDRLDAFSGVDISNLDAEGNLVGIVGVA